MTINVLDVNDNAPVCAETPFSVVRDEGNTNSLVIETLSASDADSGVNGEIL